MFFEEKTVINFYLFLFYFLLINQWLMECCFIKFVEIKSLNYDINVNNNKGLILLIILKVFRLLRSIWLKLWHEMVTIKIWNISLLNNVRWFVFRVYLKLRNRHFYFHDPMFIICCMLRSSYLLLFYVLNALILCA